MSTFDYNINQQLNIPHGVLEYIAGFDPQEIWEARGIKRNHLRIKKLQNKNDNELKQVINTSEFESKLTNFIKESLGLFNALIAKDQKIISKYIGDKEFYFIVGVGRTGGTYLMKEVSKALEFPMKKLLPSIIHDTLPSAGFIMDGLDRDKVGWTNIEKWNIGWRKPNNYFNLLFEIASFLVYIKRTVGNQKKIVKKKDWLCLCLNLLDEIFGEQANYIITVRHPAAITASKLDKQGALGVRVNNKEKRRRLFKIWEVIYTETLRDGIPQGEITPVLYGPDMDEFLYNFFRNNGLEDKPEGVKIANRNYDYEYWNQEEFINRMERVKELWDWHGLDFPLPKEIL
ncbi:hypothetical protein [Orenia marismortui]|uniref:Sulfotransferase family protein n=1 Tax=Orenia marismortui TaxID=46469 RepID=A0A4R8HR05_9FIRM|nr:hypothetical protein [Orenia marismortui]TDX58907.1 hypothetical protein C7959_10245 [Orenia marismortui]